MTERGYNAMKYFVTNKDRQGTCYHEFYKGKWDGKTFWKDDSICLHDDVLWECSGFEEAIRTVISSYDPFGETEITQCQWEEIGRLIEGKDAMSKEIYAEANIWAEGVYKSHDCFTILGI